MPGKRKLGVFKFASCDGCQLTLLSVEEQLPALSEPFDIAYFLEASSRIEPGPYDVALVEGSITTPDDAERIRQIRRDARRLVTIGACATAGGIQALRNWAAHGESLAAVYPQPQWLRTLATSTPIREHVPVDFELRGCPIDPRQLFETLRALLADRTPALPRHSVCHECKRRGAVCVLVTGEAACLGPVTQDGCGAICPRYRRGCYGCFGPAAEANLVPLSGRIAAAGFDPQRQLAQLRNFNAWAPEFRAESDRLEGLSVEPRR